MISESHELFYAYCDNMLKLLCVNFADVEHQCPPSCSSRLHPGPVKAFHLLFEDIVVIELRW